MKMLSIGPDDLESTILKITGLWPVHIKVNKKNIFVNKCTRTTKNGKLYYTLTFALYENGEMPSNRVAWMDSWMDPQHHNILNTVHEYTTYYNI